MESLVEFDIIKIDIVTNQVLEIQVVRIYAPDIQQRSQEHHSGFGVIGFGGALLLHPVQVLGVYVA